MNCNGRLLFLLISVFFIFIFSSSVFASFEVKSVSVALSATAGPTGNPDFADIVRVTATIKNHATANALCGYDIWETNPAGTVYNCADDGQELFRGGEQKTVYAYLPVAHDPSATYYFKVLVGDAAIPYVAGHPIAGEIHHSKMISISDFALHQPRLVPSITVQTLTRTLPGTGRGR